MFHLKMAYKTRPKTLILGTGFIFFYTLLATLGMKDIVSWYYIKLLIMILPVFYAGNTISNEYEYNREGILFTSKTPIYVQGLTQFISALLVNCVMITLMYLSAYISGLEHNLLGFVPLVAYACFLSALAFTCSNITRKNAVGFAAAILYWGLFFMTGQKANELLMPLSILINVNLSYDIIWYNVLSMMSFAIILFLWNIWYLGKGEGVRRKLTFISIPTTLLLVVLLIITPDTSYLIRTDWQTKTEGDVTLLYQDLPPDFDQELLGIWSQTYEVLTDILGTDAVYDTLQISCETGLQDEPKVTEDAVTLRILRSAFNDPMIGGEFFNQTIPEVAFITHFFSEFEDYYLLKGFSNYLVNTRVDTTYKEGHLETLTHILSAQTFDDWMLQDLGGLLLQSIETEGKHNLDAFLVSLSQLEGPVTLEHVTDLAKDYTSQENIDAFLALYEKANTVY